MFPEDDDTDEEFSHEDCTISSDFTDLLSEWKYTQDGMDLHTAQHMLHALLFHMRQIMTPMDLVGFCFNTLQIIETLLKSSNYRLEYPDGSVRLYDTPEHRQAVEKQLSEVEVPDAVPDWLTAEGETE